MLSDQVGVQEVDQVRVVDVPHHPDLGENEVPAGLLGEVNVLDGHPATRGALRGQVDDAGRPVVERRGQITGHWDDRGQVRTVHTARSTRW